MREPDYEQAEANALPEITLEQGRLRVIAGRYGNAVSPIDRTACEATVMELQLAPGGHFAWAPPAGQLAVLDGDGEIGIGADTAGAGMLLLSGRPLGEPIVQYGPFVMNTTEQIRQAIRDYQSGALVAPLG